MKKRILFLFGSIATSRSFSEFQILDNIAVQGTYEVFCGLREHSKDSGKSPILSSLHVPITRFPGSSNSWKAHQLWIQIAMARLRKSNPAYTIKVSRAVLGDFKRKAFLNYFDYLKHIFKVLFRLRSLLTLLSMLPFLGDRLEEIAWNQIPRNQYLETLIERIKPNLIILVSTGSEPLLAELQRVKITLPPWVLLPDNWDNVFTKTILRIKPSELWLWSKQQEDFVIRTNVATESKIRIVGSSRLTDNTIGNLNSNLSWKYSQMDVLRILYAGQEAPHDEIADLIWIYRYLSTGLRGFNRNIEIHYRPHPTARPRSKRAHNFPDLEDVIDSNIGIKVKMITHESGIFRHQNNDVRKSIQDVDAVIGAPTTLLLESLFYKVPSAVILRDDFLHRTTSLHVWKSYLHFRDLESVPNFKIIREPNELVSFIHELNIGKPVTSNNAMEYFTGEIKKPYYLSLLDALGEVLTSR